MRTVQRSSADIIHLAQEAIRKDLLEREASAPRDLVSAVPSEHRDAAAKLLASLESALEIDVRKLRPEDRMGDIFRVPRAKVPALDSEWKRFGLADYVEPFAFDILTIVERLSTKSGWIRQRQQLRSPPQSEDQWLDAIMEMTVAEFLAFFAAAMARDV
jgi:hypothetical protein